MGTASDGAVIPFEASDSDRRFPPATSYSRNRAAALIAVLLLHAAAIAVLFIFPSRNHLPSPVPPILVSMINEAPSHTEALSLPHVVLEQPHVTAVTPEVPTTASPPDAPIIAPPSSTVAAVAVSGVKESTGPAETVSPPRFDAAYLKNPAPSYPAASRRMHEQGTVLMRVRVSVEGLAAEVLIEKSSGSIRLDEAAMAAVRRWRFLPAHRGALPVEAWVLVPVEFELQR